MANWKKYNKTYGGEAYVDLDKVADVERCAEFIGRKEFTRLYFANPAKSIIYTDAIEPPEYFLDLPSNNTVGSDPTDLVQDFRLNPEGKR